MQTTDPTTASSREVEQTPSLQLRKRAFGWAVLVGMLAMAASAHAQAPKAPTAPPAPQGATPNMQNMTQSAAVPSFWDPKRRPEKPDTTRVTLIRFVTEVDYPPFDYAGADGNPAGFNVDLARLICDELKIPCTMQMRRFDTLVDSLNDNRSDAVIASIAVTADTRQRIDFSDPYYRPAGRFVGRKQAVIADIYPEQ